MAEKIAIITTAVFPPIPTPDFDWSAHFDWDDEGQTVGYGATEAKAVLDLLNKAAEADNDGSEQDSLVDLAFAGWYASKSPKKDKQ